MLSESLAVMSNHDEADNLLKSKDSLSTKEWNTTLILKPYNDSQFQIRTLELKEKVKIRIGRQTSSKTLPSPFNGFFDSKVLSRQHAEIWCDKSKVYIKDVKSSNGTFVNGERLSNECEESEPRELNNGDEIEFGIDIINENGSTYLFPIPLSQVDNTIIKELSNTENSRLLVRKSSASTISTSSSINSDIANSASSMMTVVTGEAVTDSGDRGKRLKKMETVLNKLQSELEKSKKVEKELKTIKDAVGYLNKVFSQDKIKQSDELEIKLNQAETQIKAFDEKWRQQNQAIQTAKNELHRLEKELSTWRLEKENLKRQIIIEREKVKDLEVQLLKQSNNTNKSRNTQLVIALLIAVISILIYFSL
ncbi:uncharacterized protein BX663DRAFT_553236 [Cokeromyces recurvatus]|uniref:uncharacterized protein n=1 Tax=Cokeromyces recurvatus TaxID=90255 RepID=UPI0022204C71|nr:uncharacterized protein BX663DRAFT_553236 [Cokeromyces recurvatus]KAI7901436.1 hypothetical protein BX663DRAFT_553236 [Cokeromyces recurvatus]